jgi:hypothetical protein
MPNGVKQCQVGWAKLVTPNVDFSNNLVLCLFVKLSGTLFLLSSPLRRKGSLDSEQIKKNRKLKNCKDVN